MALNVHLQQHRHQDAAQKQVSATQRANRLHRPCYLDLLMILLISITTTTMLGVKLKSTCDFTTATFEVPAYKLRLHAPLLVQRSNSGTEGSPAAQLRYEQHQPAPSSLTTQLAAPSIDDVHPCAATLDVPAYEPHLHGLLSAPTPAMKTIQQPNFGLHNTDLHHLRRSQDLRSPTPVHRLAINTSVFGGCRTREDDDQRRQRHHATQVASACSRPFKH